MRILALETSAWSGSVAGLDDGRPLAECALPEGTRSAQSLIPTVQRLLRQLEWSPAELDLIAVSEGPGSFTGLRVGVTTAKTLAYAIGAQVAGVNTLEVIAAQSESVGQRLWAVLDAQRQQLFAARFVRASGEGWRVELPTRVVDREAWLLDLAAGDRVTGSGLAPLTASLPQWVVIESESAWEPRAATVGQLAYRQRHQIQAAGVWSLAPKYYRRSAAEEKADR